jgi:hypothetical protein
MESYEDRLKRFQDGSPTEVISTLTNSINNFLNPEIATAAESDSWSLMVIGIHAVALTLSKGLFGLTGKDAYLRFLRTFVDDAVPGGDFSVVGADIHRWRNVVAHQWLSAAGYTIGFDTSLVVGWERRNGVLVVNPTKYHQGYRRAFQTGSKLWRPQTILSPTEMEAAKARLIDNFVRDSSHGA